MLHAFSPSEISCSDTSAAKLSFPMNTLAEDIFQEVIAIAAVRKRDKIENAAHLMRLVVRKCREGQCGWRCARKRGVHPMVFDTEVLDALEGHWQSADKESSSDEIEMRCASACKSSGDIPGN